MPVCPLVWHPKILPGGWQGSGTRGWSPSNLRISSDWARYYICFTRVVFISQNFTRRLTGSWYPRMVSWQSTYIIWLGQVLHLFYWGGFIGWCDIRKFYQEVDWVLVPEGGVLAIYGYHLTGPGITYVCFTRVCFCRVFWHPLILPGGWLGSGTQGWSPSNLWKRFHWARYYVCFTRVVFYPKILPWSWQGSGTRGWSPSNLRISSDRARYYLYMFY